MQPRNAQPLPAIALQAISNLAQSEEIPEQASFPWFEGAMLAIESCEVIRIRIRLAMFAIGGEHADFEAKLMVSEKIDAMFEAGASVMAGKSAASVIGRYREHVAANTRRLSAI